MPTKNTYSIKEEFILALIEMNSDSKVSNISRAKLMELSGIKDPDTITVFTNKYQANGDLTKTYSHKSGKKLVQYNLTPVEHNFIIIYNSLLQFGECTGLAIKMAKLRLKGTSEIRMSNNAIIKKLGLTKPTFLKYRNMLLEKKILFTTENGYCLNTEYFPIIENINPETRNHMNNLLSLDDLFIGKKVFLTYYNKNFAGLTCSIDYFVNWCLSGCPGLKQKKTKEKISEIDYKF